MKKQAGFTLIEIMIVVVVISILASIAIPAYSDYVARAKRAQAQGALFELSSAMERFLLKIILIVVLIMEELLERT